MQFAGAVLGSAPAHSVVPGIPCPRFPRRLIRPHFRPKNYACNVLPKRDKRRSYRVRTARAQLDESRRLHGDDSDETQKAMLNLAVAHYLAEDYSTAKATADTVLVIRRARYGIDHVLTAAAENVLAGCLAGMGDLQAALKMQEHVVSTYEDHFGPESRWTAFALTRLGIILGQAGDYGASETVHARAASIMNDTKDSDGSDTKWSNEWLTVTRQAPGLRLARWVFVLLMLAGLAIALDFGAWGAAVGTAAGALLIIEGLRLMEATRGLGSMRSVIDLIRALLLMLLFVGGSFALLVTTPRNPLSQAVSSFLLTLWIGAGLAQVGALMHDRATRRGDRV